MKRTRSRTNPNHNTKVLVIQVSHCALNGATALDGATHHTCRPNGLTMFVRKPEASGKERRSDPGIRSYATCSYEVIETCKPSSASPHYSYFLLSKVLIHRCMTSGGSASPRFRLMIFSPIRASLLCDIGLFLANRSTLRGWRLSLQKALLALTTLA
jgi:hypothetical protein